MSANEKVQCSLHLFLQLIHSASLNWFTHAAANVKIKKFSGHVCCVQGCWPHHAMQNQARMF
jgi:hypothetical protein